ncbi:MAG: hypothetical protein AAGM22_33555 [Acidobacteriota bacterium]
MPPTVKATDYSRSDFQFASLSLMMTTGMTLFSVMAFFATGPDGEPMAPTLVLMLIPVGTLLAAYAALRWQVATVNRKIRKGDLLLRTVDKVIHENDGFFLAVYGNGPGVRDRFPTFLLANARTRRIQPGGTLTFPNLGLLLPGRPIVLEALLDEDEVEAIRASLQN